MLDKDFRNNVKTLKNIGDHFASHLACGKSLKEMIIQDFEDMGRYFLALGRQTFFISTLVLHPHI